MKYKIIPTDIPTTCFYFDKNGKQITGVYNIEAGSEDYSFHTGNRIRYANNVKIDNQENESAQLANSNECNTTDAQVHEKEISVKSVDYNAVVNDSVSKAASALGSLFGSAKKSFQNALNDDGKGGD